MEKYFNKNFYNISSVKDEISKLLSKTNSSVYYMFKLENLRGIWIDIVGEKLCNLTNPEYIYKNTLCVYCKHSGLIQSLNFYKNEILKKIQNKMPELKINDIYFSMKKK